MASAVNPISSTSGAANAVASATGTQAAPTEQMFLQLLVAQLQNQDPLNPTDGTTFVTQLAQFSELEQVIAIRGDIENASAAQQAAAAAAAATGTGTNTSQTNGTGNNGTGQSDGTGQVTSTGQIQQ